MKKIFRIQKSIIGVFIISLLTVSCVLIEKERSWPGVYIIPGALWLDNNDNPIQAHGGGIIRIGNIYYWFGEDRAKHNNPAYRYVGCYSSEDLTHWTFKRAIKFSPPSGFGRGWVLERPKVYYNAKAKKYVMYFHLDDSPYKAAEIGIAVSDSVDGNYHFVKQFRPLGMESRDIGQFIDDDGTAYLIFESRPTHGFVIARLSSDYMSIEKEVCLVKEPLEGGALVAL